MSGYTDDFQDFEGHVWLNAASEGPLPKVAAQALNESVIWKSRPYLLDIPKFVAVPLGLKKSIARMLHVEAQDVILANSASYGVHILANGYPWAAGDEVVLMKNDFPTDILPWLALEDKGVVVQQLDSPHRVLQPEDLEGMLHPRVKVLCLPHVHTFSGCTLDIPGFARLCRKNNIMFVLNISQSAGTMPLDITTLGCDAVVCAGYKWLCGPYGTGFFWMTPRLREMLDYNQSYWISALSESELHSEEVLMRKKTSSARKYDVFGTANFFNFVPFKASLDYLLEIGEEVIRQHNQNLLAETIRGLGSDYTIVAPQEGTARSNLLVISHRKEANNKVIFDHLSNRDIHVALWKGKIRIAPHLYNTPEDIQKLLGCLNTVSF